VSLKEVYLGEADEFREPRVVRVYGRDILVVRVPGGFLAVSAKCPHKGADLSQGAVCGKKVICPWHNAVFDLETGNVLEPPALSGLDRFSVEQRGSAVFVKVPAEGVGEAGGGEWRPGRRVDEVFVVIGGGASGAIAAKTLREAGFDGEVVLVSAEEHLPYDRTILSKFFLTHDVRGENLYLWDEAFWRALGVKLLLGRRVVELDVKSRAAVLDSGESISYDKVLIATGGRPRRLGVPGEDLRGVFTLRTLDDAILVKEWAAASRRAVLVGAGFLNMEVASALRSRGIEVTVVAPESVPLSRVFGEEVGSFIRELYEENGVAFALGHVVEEIEGDGRVRGVVLDNGRRLPADMVLVGVGIEPVTDFVRGLGLDERGRIPVDEYMHAGNGVYAAGDVVSFPDWRTGMRVSVEHWRTAQQLGRIAALNMAGLRTPYRGVPFFWTSYFGLSFRYVGHAPVWDDLLIKGDLKRRSFLALYSYRDRVLGVLGCGRDKEVAAISDLMARGLLPRLSEVRDNPGLLEALARC